MSRRAAGRLGRKAARHGLLVLIGLRATGKTSLGRALARRLGWPFADGDAELRVQTGRSAAVWLRNFGEAAFRRAEERVTLRLLARRGPLVVALGGGAVSSPRVRLALRRGPRVVWLRAAVAELVRRLRNGARARPPLTGLPLAQEVAHLARVRAPRYREVAEITLNTTRGNVEDWLEVLLARLRLRS